MTIFTVGHGARPADELVAILRGADVRRLVDVRTAPGSRRHPQFGREALTASLESGGIGYAWRKDLGGWRTPRPASPHTALRSGAFQGYADYMDTPEFEAALSWLIETAAEATTAFMCAETLWWNCHRRMISDALTARGHQVIHLMRPGERRPHRLHPVARLTGGRLVYDRDRPAQADLPG
jgi:uncharacterized protein (DUF488 family)